MIKIITDSSADLPKELLDRYDVAVVPLKIQLENEEFLEGINLTPKEFFVKMFSSSELPKTSQPSPAAFAEVFNKFEKNDELLCLTISSGLSGTYQSALLGKDISNRNVTVFDTLAGSLSHGLQVVRAAELAEKGHSMEEIVENLAEYRKNMNILILLDTLENIVKGGRLSRFQGSVAKILNIKVILEGINGVVEMKEKIRGTKKFHKRTIEIISERKADFSDTIFGITHTGNEDDAELMRQEIIQNFNPKDVIVHYMGATMGTYAGKNGMIISF
ncbi:DegV family protein [Bacillus canaveralius]|uniref:DegV family protein n=1 Tax=Bacillus canaveralius TaxID=1403243 RepID=A0A2N5GSM2_9BACI|nr:DegV family protein [Bacillus canaveralius]PLR86771.1 DegV family protein [Bacillus canaveralius]PLR92768.1 DegV family protein [Bacillus canaveralius]